MPLLPILVIPHRKLRQVAAPVSTFDSKLAKLADSMLQTMYEAPGIGLAAPQVGVMQRIVVADVAMEEEDQQPIVMINPKIVSASEERNVHEEGCLSIPDYMADVERPAEVQVAFQDVAGGAQEMNCAGLLATCIQHEIDHLDGILFIDYLSRLKRQRVESKFAKMALARNSSAK